MPIDADALLAAPGITWDSSWTSRDVILYHLGIGAGVPATDPRELRRTYERDLQVLPTFGTVPGFMPIDRFLELPGLGVDLRRLVHGEHDLRVHAPLPVQATATSTCRAVAVRDLRTAASVVFEITTQVDGRTLLTNLMTAFVKGEGGVSPAGDVPEAPRVRPPRRDPDVVVAQPTLEQQALLYRLCGDANPLHVDPDFAAAGGFERPILHGMCTFGMVGRAVVEHLLDGDGDRVARVRGRFSDAVLPGEELTHRLWAPDEAGEEVVVEVRAGDRVVLKQAAVTLR